MTKFTKIAALTALTAIGAASTASAAGFSIIPDIDDRASFVELGTVTADMDGFVEIRATKGGVLGDVIGVAEVNQGANSNVKVRFSTQPTQDVVAFLFADGASTPADVTKIDVE